MDCFILLTAGGIQIRSAVMGKKGEVLSPIVAFDACAGGSRTEILTNLYGILRNRMREIDENHLCGVGIVFPGPFDCQLGVSHMRGLHKYDSIEGVPIKEALLGIERDQPGLHFLGPEMPCLFLHDMHAFALGCCAEIPAFKQGRNMFVCIGTGIGSAFMENNLRTSVPELSEDGWIYDRPFRDGIVDDYLSARGLVRLYDRNCYMEPESIGDLANRGDVRALCAFERFGQIAEEILGIYIERFSPDRLILSGGLVHAARHFIGPLQKKCMGQGIQLIYSPNTYKRELLGLLSCFSEDTVVSNANLEPTKEELSRQKGCAPLYGQIEEILREEIERGAYAYGDLFPSEKQLLTRFDVSRMTIRQAVGGLTRDGYVECARGIGTHVTYRPHSD